MTRLILAAAILFSIAGTSYPSHAMDWMGWLPFNVYGKQCPQSEPAAGTAGCSPINGHYCAFHMSETEGTCQGWDAQSMVSCGTKGVCEHP